MKKENKRTLVSALSMTSCACELGGVWLRGRLPTADIGRDALTTCCFFSAKITRLTRLEMGKNCHF